MMNRYEEALKAYEQALTLDPKNARDWICKGATLNCLTQYAEALSCCDRALSLEPLKEAWHTKGEVLGKLGRYTEAIECFDQALKIDPDFQISIDEREQTLKMQQEYEQQEADKRK
ncbi:MAG: tetratricopeptide repeat protein [Candidatus Hodarchaeota archaeon]